MYVVRTNNRFWEIFKTLTDALDSAKGKAIYDKKGGIRVHSHGSKTAKTRSVRSKQRL